MAAQQDISLLTRRSFTHLSAMVTASALGCVFLPGCLGAGVQASSSTTTDPNVTDPSTTTDPNTANPSTTTDPNTTDPATADSMLMHLPTEDDGLAGVEFFAFDTICSLKAYTTDRVLEQLYERCLYFENCFSRQRAGSDIYRVNAAQGQPVEVAPETADLVRSSLAYCEASNGLFDITIGAATELWDFNEGVVADADALAEAIRHIDWRGVHVDGSTIQLEDPAARLDLGGVAKGYIADALADMLRDAGCSGGLINLGGNVYALGTKPDGRPWNVGLQDPNDVRNAVFGKLEATDASVVTSGLYERNFEEDGVLYYHILDPKTGYPAETDLVASTIQSAQSIDGDAYATILFLQGASVALETLEAAEDLEGLVVASDGTVFASSGFVWEEL